MFECAMPPHAVSTEEELAFLREQIAPAGGTRGCELVETHVSWLLLGAGQVLKLKKPVRSTLFDFSTPAARERNAHEEVRVNRRLAAGVYLGVLGLQWDGARFTLVPEDQIDPRRQTVDWIVLMRRLPRRLMLDRLLDLGTLEPGHIDALLGVLLPFYRDAAPVRRGEAAYAEHLRQEQARHRDVLCRPAFATLMAGRSLDRLDAALIRYEGALRVRAHHIVEGHGDLRPEHVCLLDPPVVIDALEFNARLRELDPFGELAAFGLECSMGGAPWVAGRLAAAARRALADELPEPLWALYTACHAALRARLSVAHLLEAPPRTPARWLPLGRRYLSLADEALGRLHGPALTAPHGKP
jgi:aminoglycoside phosphotransferase family enzyme